MIWILNSEHHFETLPGLRLNTVPSQSNNWRVIKWCLWSVVGTNTQGKVVASNPVVTHKKKERKKTTAWAQLVTKACFHVVYFLSLITCQQKWSPTSPGNIFFLKSSAVGCFQVVKHQPSYQVWSSMFHILHIFHFQVSLDISSLTPHDR